MKNEAHSKLTGGTIKMTKKDFEYIKEMTEASCYYNKGRKCWCALWLADKSEHKLFFNPNFQSKFDVVEKILSLQIGE